MNLTIYEEYLWTYDNACSLSTSEIIDSEVNIKFYDFSLKTHICNPLRPKPRPRGHALDKGLHRLHIYVLSFSLINMGVDNKVF